MHVLYLHRGYFPALAGAEMMVRRLASAMQKRGHQVLLVSQGAGDQVVEMRIEDLTVMHVPPEKLGDLATLLPPAELVHVFDAVWPEYPEIGRQIAEQWGVPLAMTPASTINVWHEPERTLAVCRSADVVFVLTEAERDVFHQHGVTADRLIAVGQGPQLSGSPDPLGFRQQYGVTGPLVLFLGRKVAFKGYKVLLSASKAVWQQHPDTHFVFIGPRWDADCLETFQAFRDPRIVEIDQVDEQSKYSALAACDLLCLPTTTDVFPLVFVEAWSCGKPVITGPFPGAQEVVHAGRDGLICAAEPSALAAAIVQLLDDPALRQTMGAMGRSRVEQQFNWEVIAGWTEQSYMKLLHGASV